MILLDNCPCGMPHRPSECPYMDFADCDVWTSEYKVWLGVEVDHEDCDEDFPRLEMIVFDPSYGGAVSIIMSAEDLLELSKRMAQVARRSLKGHLDKEDTAVQEREVRAYYEKEYPRYIAIMDEEKVAS